MIILLFINIKKFDKTTKNYKYNDNVCNEIHDTKQNHYIYFIMGMIDCSRHKKWMYILILLALAFWILLIIIVFL